MPIHDAVASRFTLLEGIASLDEVLRLMADTVTQPPSRSTHV